MKKRNVLHSPRLLELKKRRKKVFIGKILICFLGVVVILVGFSFLSRIKSLNISEVEVTGNKTVDTEMIKAAVNDTLAGKYLWLFPKTNIFLYPNNLIKENLQDKFKRLKDINLNIHNKVLTISVGERVAKYTWCGVALPTVEQKEQCYFLDDSGFIFDEAPYFSGEVYFKFYGLQNSENYSTETNPLGSYFYKNNFSNLVSLKDTLLSIKLKPVAMYVKPDQDIEIYLSRGSSILNAPKILVKLNSDFEKVAEYLQAALTTEPLMSKFKNKYSSLLYLDLRFGNRVISNFK